VGCKTGWQGVLELRIGYAPVTEYTIETILKVMRALDIKLHPEAVHMVDKQGGGQFSCHPQDAFIDSRLQAQTSD